MTDKKDGWDREPGTHEIERNGKKYRNLVLFTKPCAQCGERFGIYVSQAVASGHKSNNNFGLKNCEKHRQRNGDPEELARLRTENTNLRTEVAGNASYIATLEAELAQHRPPTVQEVLQKTLPWTQ